jgi:hypothetical protein
MGARLGEDVRRAMPVPPTLGAGIVASAGAEQPGTSAFVGDASEAEDASVAVTGLVDGGLDA